MDLSAGMLPVSIGDMGSYLSYSGLSLALNRITIDNPTPGTGSIVAKLDILYYHRLSLTGDILSSIVMIGTPTNILNALENRYAPKFIYNNSALEKSINIPVDATNFTLFNVLNITQLVTPLSDVSLFNGQKTALPVNGLPSAVISRDSIAKDGWYSIFSVGVCDQLVSPGFVKKGFLCQDTTNTQQGDFPQLGQVFVALVDGAIPSELADPTQWQPIDRWSTTGSIANMINLTLEYNPWVRRDLFWMAEYNKVYRDTVIDYVESDNNFGNAYINMKALQTAIDYYAKKSRFAEAQYILQGTDYYRTTHNFLA